MAELRILVINPGSTSTKIAVFDGKKEIGSANVKHDAQLLMQYATLDEQKKLRKQAILEELEKMSVPLESIDVFSGRGGGLELMESGVYEIRPGSLIYEHARVGRTAKHPACLGVVLACELSQLYGKRAFTVDTTSTDEVIEEAKFTGIKGKIRLCYTHALNQKEVARRYAAAQGKSYQELNLVIAHIGGGVSVTAHRKGRMIDSSNCLGANGPFAPTRCGGVPVQIIIDMCFDGKHTKKEMDELITKNGGMVSHLGTSDMREVHRMIENGDAYAGAVYRTMIYQIEKEIGAMHAALKGETDAILLTGGIANDEELTGIISDDLSRLAPVTVIPGEFEMEALAHGALAAMEGRTEIKTYLG